MEFQMIESSPVYSVVCLRQLTVSAIYRIALRGAVFALRASV